MKRIFLISVFVLLLPGIAWENEYDKYSKVYLKWAAPPLTVASYVVPCDGLYHVVFQAQVVNHSAGFGKETLVMFNARLCVNGIKVKGWTENVDQARHYGNPTLVKDLFLLAGDVIEIKMRADSMTRYPSHSVFVLTDYDRFQFDVSKF